MGRIAHLLADCPADKRRVHPRITLLKEQWDDILAADARGVTSRAMFAALNGKITPFYSTPSSFKVAMYAERRQRKTVTK